MDKRFPACRVRKQVSPIDAVFAASLGFPTSTGDEFVSLGGSMVTIGGWVLPLGESIARVVAVYGAEEREIEFNSIRKDVMKLVAKIENPRDEESVVGFVEQFPISQKIDIYVAVNGKRHHWASLSIEQSDSKFCHTMVLEGKDGYLFLANDSNRVRKQITGTYPLPIDFGEKWARLLEYRRNYFFQNGMRYLMAIAPNKECVYDQYLPREVRLVDRRPVHHVIEAVNGVNICYPINELRAQRETKMVYSKGDTHWDAPGAYLMYREMMRMLGVECVPEDKISYEEGLTNGDLSGKIGLKSKRVSGTVKDWRAKLVYSNDVIGVGRKLRYERPDEGLRAVVFQDSFGNGLSELLSETFKTVTMVWQPNIDYSIIEQEKPDIVISQQCERFLVAVPDDLGGMTNEQYAQKKREGVSTLNLGG